MRSTARSSRRALAVGLAAVLVLGAACSDDEGDSGDVEVIDGGSSGSGSSSGSSSSPASSSGSSSAPAETTTTTAG